MQHNRKSFPSLFLIILLSFSARAEDAPAFTAEQVAGGEQVYKELCQICHGSTLANGQFGTPLRGAFFRNNWKGKSLGELLKFTYESMPPENVMGLPLEQYAEVLAFILEANDLAPGEMAMPGDYEALMGVMLPW